MSKLDDLMIDYFAEEINLQQLQNEIDSLELPEDELVRVNEILLVELKLIELNQDQSRAEATVNKALDTIKRGQESIAFRLVDEYDDQPIDITKYQDDDTYPDIKAAGLEEEE